MKAIKIIKEGLVQSVELPRPDLRVGHVLLKIDYVGFCGSDLNTFRGLNPLVRLPIIPGHEIAGTVVEIGADVAPEIQMGMRVTVNPYSNCGRCAACKNNKPNACQFNETMGVQRDGAMAAYIAVPYEKVIPGDGLSAKELALVEPMSVGFHAVDRASVTDNDVVLVLGCGMIGIGAIIRAVRRGASVISSDVSESKLALARRLGAKFSINTAAEDLKQRLDELTNFMGADVVIEAVGRQETYLAAIDAVTFTGRVVFIGYAKEPIPFDTQFFVKKELDIMGSRNALPKDFEAVMDYLKSGTCPVDQLITAVCTPDGAHAALNTWVKDPGSVFRILVKF